MDTKHINYGGRIREARRRLEELEGQVAKQKEKIASLEKSQKDGGFTNGS